MWSFVSGFFLFAQGFQASFKLWHILVFHLLHIHFFHCMGIPHFIDPFIRWWAIELFPLNSSRHLTTSNRGQGRGEVLIHSICWFHGVNTPVMADCNLHDVTEHEVGEMLKQALVSPCKPAPVYHSAHLYWRVTQVTRDVAIHYYFVGVCAQSLQSCPTLCDPMDCSQAPLSTDSPGTNTDLGIESHLLRLLHCRQSLYRWATGEAPLLF